MRLESDDVQLVTRGPAGAPIEAILKTGPRMLWWNEEPFSSEEIAALYKLFDGQDKTFMNAMLQRLADSFRTGNNFTRLCILKAFLLVSKSSERRGRGGTGLFKKERIANHQEVLKRVKAVMDSGDVVARALALRMLGCLGEIAADSLDVHRLVIEAFESPHQKEVRFLLLQAKNHTAVTSHLSFGWRMIPVFSHVLNTVFSPDYLAESFAFCDLWRWADGCRTFRHGLSVRVVIKFRTGRV